MPVDKEQVMATHHPNVPSIDHARAINERFVEIEERLDRLENVAPAEPPPPQPVEHPDGEFPTSGV